MTHSIIQNGMDLSFLKRQYRCRKQKYNDHKYSKSPDQASILVYIQWNFQAEATSEKTKNYAPATKHQIQIKQSKIVSQRSSQNQLFNPVLIHNPQSKNYQKTIKENADSPTV